MCSTVSTDLDMDEKKHSKRKTNMLGVLHLRFSLNQTSITNTSSCQVFCVNTTSVFHVFSLTLNKIQKRLIKWDANITFNTSQFLLLIPFSILVMFPEQKQI